METAEPRTTTFTYRNPIIDADWPDPDAIRVGSDYFLVASSFNRTPGLPVLHSRDLVNWTRIGYALDAVPPREHYALPRHGSGVWAPSIRHHDGLFHIVYPDPDHGILVVSAAEASGPWSEPRLLLAGLGLIDPCPLWDDDGRTWLVHGWARSRAGIKNLLSIVEVDAGLTRAVGVDRVLLDGDDIEGCVTLEGPKIHRRGDWYWVLAPAGGVATGWQYAFRSRDLEGPWEHRIVLEQGDTPVNGPHQGAWVDGVDGRDWFVHFQDRGVFGRVVHLQPMQWTEDGWPVMGEAREPGRPGVPVLEHPMPAPVAQRSRTLAQGDDFREGPGSQWYWQATPGEGWAVGGAEGLRLHGPANDAGGLRTLPQILAQQLPGRPSTVTTRVTLEGPPDARAGLVVLGADYLWAGLRRVGDGVEAVVAVRTADDRVERALHVEPWDGALDIRLDVDEQARVSIVLDGGSIPVATGFTARSGLWIGAEIGLFAAAPLGAQTEAVATVPFFGIEVDDGC